MSRPKPCKDCLREGVSTKRQANWPGPRCYTHHLVEKRRAKKAKHGYMVKNVYGLTGDDYDLLYKVQGGRCYICRVATGASKMLAVDHDHNCDQGHDPHRGCRKCVRALICGRCNKLVAFLGPEALRRAIEVLVDPPARKVLGTSNTS